MSKAEDVTIEKVLKDARLAPTDKVVYLALLTESEYDVIDPSMDNIDKYLTYEVDGEIRTLSTARREKAFSVLKELGYIDEENEIVSSTKDKLMEASVQYIMDYVSEARIVRGYSSRKLTAKPYRDVIRARLRDGYTVDECIAVVNYRFESDWHKRNYQHLVPGTIFRPKKFIDALSNIGNVSEWADLEITKYGVAKSTDEEELLGEM